MISDFTSEKYPWPYHLNEERRLLTVFNPTGQNTVRMVQTAQKSFPGHLVTFTRDYKDLERLHGLVEGMSTQTDLDDSEGS